MKIWVTETDRTAGSACLVCVPRGTCSRGPGRRALRGAVRLTGATCQEREGTRFSAPSGLASLRRDLAGHSSKVALGMLPEGLGERIGRLHAELGDAGLVWPAVSAATVVVAVWFDRLVRPASGPVTPRVRAPAQQRRSLAISRSRVNPLIPLRNRSTAIQAGRYER